MPDCQISLAPPRGLATPPLHPTARRSRAPRSGPSARAFPCKPSLPFAPGPDTCRRSFLALVLGAAPDGRPPRGASAAPCSWPGRRRPRSARDGRQRRPRTARPPPSAVTPPRCAPGLGLSLGQELLIEMLAQPLLQVVAGLDRVQQPQHVSSSTASPSARPLDTNGLPLILAPISSDKGPGITFTARMRLPLAESFSATSQSNASAFTRRRPVCSAGAGGGASLLGAATASSGRRKALTGSGGGDGRQAQPRLVPRPAGRSCGQVVRKCGFAIPVGTPRGLALQQPDLRAGCPDVRRPQRGSRSDPLAPIAPASVKHCVARAIIRSSSLLSRPRT